MNDIEGRIYTGEEIYGKENDFCLTVNDVADMLAYAVPTVQRFILPKLDRAYADEHIKDYMINNRIKLVISKQSLIRFLGLFFREEKRNIIYCLRKDSENLQENFLKLRMLTKDNRDMKARMQKAAQELNKKYDSKNFKALEENNIIEVMNYKLFSVREIQSNFNFKHIMQIYRFLETQNYIKIKLGNLQSSDTDCKKNIRYLFVDGTEWGAEGENCVYVSLSSRVTNKLNSLSGITNVEFENLLMELLINEIEKKI